MTLKSVTLSDACILRGQYGFTTSASQAGTRLKFLRTTDLRGGRIEWENVPYCAEAPSDRGRYLLRDGDIVISRMGTIGLAQYVQDPPEAVFASYLVRFRAQPRVAHPRFLSYVLTSPMWWDYVHGRGDAGSVQPNLNARVMGEFEFGLPTLGAQRAIAEVLGALDDKIAANRRVAAQSRELRSAILSDRLAGQRYEQPLDAVVTLLTRGRAPKYVNEPDAMIVVNQKCVREGVVSLSDARRTALTHGPMLQP